MKKATVITTLSLAALMATGSVFAEDMKRGAKMFDELDANKNGVITHKEMMASVKEKFDGFDKNKDGFIELQELPKDMPLSEHKQMRLDMMKQKVTDENREKLEKRISKMEKRKPSRIDFLSHMDDNGDEKVSLDEFSEKAIRQFKRADQNGDGEVTKEEASNMKGRHGYGKKDGKKGKYGGQDFHRDGHRS